MTCCYHPPRLYIYPVDILLFLTQQCPEEKISLVGRVHIYKINKSYNFMHIQQQNSWLIQFTDFVLLFLGYAYTAKLMSYFFIFLNSNSCLIQKGKSLMRMLILKSYNIYLLFDNGNTLYHIYLNFVNKFVVNWSEDIMWVLQLIKVSFCFIENVI